MPSASNPRQPNRTRQPAPRPVPSGQRPMPADPARGPTRRTTDTRPPPVSRSPLSVRASSLLVVLPSKSAARAAQPAGGSRFKQQTPTQRAQAPQSHAHHARGSHGVAPAARSSYNTHARRGTQKKSSPVPMIIGAVVAVIVFAAIAFLAVPAVKGLLGGEDASVTAGQQVTVTIPEGASGDTIATILSENHIVESPKDYYDGGQKSSTLICRLSPARTLSRR